jgi:hypothetical protein
MGGVTTTDAPATGAGPARARLDRLVLTSNVVAGIWWLLVLAPPWRDQFGGSVLFLVAAAYVVAGSVFLAAVSVREGTRRQEALAWVTPWLAAVALLTLLGVSTSTEQSVSDWLLSVLSGLSIATPGYLVWQVSALAVRRLMVWRSRGDRATADPSPGG